MHIISGRSRVFIIEKGIGYRNLSIFYRYLMMLLWVFSMSVYEINYLKMSVQSGCSLYFLWFVACKRHGSSITHALGPISVMMRFSANDASIACDEKLAGDASGDLLLRAT